MENNRVRKVPPDTISRLLRPPVFRRSDDKASFAIFLGGVGEAERSEVDAERLIRCGPG